MGVSVAEYLGQRTDINAPVIAPVGSRSEIPCPFMNASCHKVQQGNKPMCAVRSSNNIPWIVCRHRLCATKRQVSLSRYQRENLLSIAKTIFDSEITADQVLIRREVSMHVIERSTYHADFIMLDGRPAESRHGPNKVVLEIQGGGETSNTGCITRHIESWESNTSRTNSILSGSIQGPGLIVTNAWRRQQEQFLIKGRIAMQTGTGCGIVFCIGSLLYDYLWARVQSSNLRNLRRHNWTLALIGFSEDVSAEPTNGPIPFVVNQDQLFFTDYQAFVRAITDVGQPSPESFIGEFDILAGGTRTIT